jgi:hypothetical protein
MDTAVRSVISRDAPMGKTVKQHGPPTMASCPNA